MTVGSVAGDAEGVGATGGWRTLCWRMAQVLLLVLVLELAVLTLVVCGAGLLDGGLGDPLASRGERVHACRVTSRAMSCTVLVRVCLVIQLLHHQPQMGAATWVPPCCTG